MHAIQILQYDDAAAIAAACHIASETMKVPVSICVVDASGRTLLMGRFDGAAFQTPEVAHGKALTAAMTRKSSKAVEDATLGGLTLTTFADGRLPIQGGLPLFANGVCVGAVGISGASSEQDERIAQAGVDAFDKANAA